MLTANLIFFGKLPFLQYYGADCDRDHGQLYVSCKMVSKLMFEEYHLGDPENDEYVFMYSRSTQVSTWSPSFSLKCLHIYISLKITRLSLLIKKNHLKFPIRNIPDHSGPRVVVIGSMGNF